MDVAQYMDSTYLKTSEQAGISEEETINNVKALVTEAISMKFKLVMIRKEYIRLAREMIRSAESEVVVGTVIGFHEGTYSVDAKLTEAQVAVDAGADELDYVINYPAFKSGQVDMVKDEVLRCTKLGLGNGKIVKWIIEIAALTEEEIGGVTRLVRDVVLENFDSSLASKVFVKSSTGFFKTENGLPSGATVSGIKIMAANSGPLPIKAAGGVRSYSDVQEMLAIGVTRFGTSSARAIVEGAIATGGY